MKRVNIFLCAVIIVFAALQSCGRATPVSITGGSSYKYAIISTGQDKCYDNAESITCPRTGEAFYGQDGEFSARKFSYNKNDDGTVTDNNTGLIWQRTMGSRMSWDDAVANASTIAIAGRSDWRVPTVKELYSLINFTGKSGATASDSIPYLDTNNFEFIYGDTAAGESLIDSPDWTSTQYVSTTMNGAATVFGVNFADGTIKGYPKLSPDGSGTPNMLYVRYVRGRTDYGINEFVDNGNGTITDNATGLMWAKDDSGSGMNWEAALAYCMGLGLVGNQDWRVPNAKELQSIVDYGRSPDTTNSAAIDPVFNSTPITNEAGNPDYAYYWTGTTHLDGPGTEGGGSAVYIAFGRALGFVETPPGSGNYAILDVHGAGSQRSDPKVGDPASYPHGFGPQGDVIRIDNFVRCVRGGESY